MNTEKTMHDAFMPETDDRCLCIQVTGVIQLASYLEDYLPRIKNMVETHGEIRLLVYYVDFKGWEEDAALFALGDSENTRKLMKKLAMVNPPDSELNRMILTGNYPEGHTRIFAESEIQEALLWVKS